VSVINQMLKDLDQRAPEQGQVPVFAVAAQKPSTIKIVLITIVVLLVLNALGFYIWGLQERAAINLNAQENMLKLQAQEQQFQVASIEHSEEVKKQKLSLPAEPDKLLVKSTPAPVMSKKEDAAQSLSLQKVDSTPVTSKAIKEETVKEIALVKEPIEAEIVNAPLPVNPAKMSVSRRQLTSKELIAQKLARAEKAVNSNEITKAEQLFEEVLIIEPAHKQARKHLAALWYGRKSYQQALNLLSQGIAIDKQDGELRLLKARIHLKQAQHEAAYNTLKPLASFEHEEYQVMLANIAQQIEQYPSAIGAYQVLINMQPYSGRWHLGLAIVYDKNSQFSLAVNEYALALTKADLSVASAKFAEQRMQALGE
jgi:MSHA biogenesis protein MshN